MIFLRPFRRVSRKRLREKFFAFVLTIASVFLVEYFVLVAPSTSIDVHNIMPLTTMLENRSPVPFSGLNVHTWSDICGTRVHVLREWPHFPFFPDKRSFILDFNKTQDSYKVNYGERVFGFIHPERSGVYKFAITSDDTSELWLSSSEDPAASEMIACVCHPRQSAWTKEGDYKKYPRQISKEITLHAGKKYYIESLMKQRYRRSHVAVYWVYGSPNTTFEIISSKYLSRFSGDDTKESVPLHVAKQKDTSTELNSAFYYVNYSSVIDREEYIRAIPSCSYNPSFLVRKELTDLQSGVELTKGYLSHVFPKDNTDMLTKGNKWSQPNHVINETRVESVVNLILQYLRASSYRSRDYVLQKIYKVIQKPDPKNGDRFLLDLIVSANNTNQAFRLTEHVYQKKGSNDLCLPEGISWNKDATIYFIVPVKDQGKWVHHLINQVTKASILTGDKNFHIIIADFESKDIDMAMAFDTPLLRNRHTIIPLTGKFYKTLALNKAVEAVPNTDDIIFLFDLHIDVPADMMDNIRKNTIAGRIAYFPIVGRLSCGSSSDDHYGFWENEGFGLLSIYKSDWNKFGGMDSENFKYSWGGEDWDLLRRVLNLPLEVERIKHSGLYHHYHTKHGKWNTK